MMVYPIVIMIVVLSHGNIIFNGLGEYISKNRYRHYLSKLISPTLLACSAIDIKSCRHAHHYHNDSMAA